jgi:hypothetical protein
VDAVWTRFVIVDLASNRSGSRGGHDLHAGGHSLTCPILPFAPINKQRIFCTGRGLHPF